MLTDAVLLIAERMRALADHVNEAADVVSRAGRSADERAGHALLAEQEAHDLARRAARRARGGAK